MSSMLGERAMLAPPRELRDRTAAAGAVSPLDGPPVPFYRSPPVLLFGFIVLAGSAGMLLETYERAGGSESLWTYASVVLSRTLVPVVFLVVAREMIRRYPLIAAGWPRTLRAHLAALGLLTALDHLATIMAVRLTPYWTPPGRPDANSWKYDVGGYLIMALLFEVARRTTRHRHLELARAALGVQVAEARRRRTEAELHALKAELNPHFLGNALASVGALLRTDRGAAERTLAQVGELLGRLGRRGEHEVTLDEELEGLEPVLEYERLRLSGRLRVVRSISAELGGALVPDMILHPLVENAVKYGLAPRGGGTLHIAAERGGADGTVLVLSVSDRGAGDDASPETAPSHGTGIGLSNVRARLVELYGSSARLELRPDGPHGMEARVTLPWRDEDSAVPALPEADDVDGDDDGSLPVGAPRDGAVPPSSVRAPWRARLRGGLAAGAPALRVVSLVAAWALISWLRFQQSGPAGIRAGIDPNPMVDAADAMLTVAIRLGGMIAGIALIRRFDRPGASALMLRVHLLTGLAVGAVLCVEKVVMLTLFSPLRMVVMPESHLLRNIVMQTLIELMIYLVAVGLYHAGSALRRSRWSQRRRLRLHQRLEEERQRGAAAELRTLQAELNPHFVGNALGVVSSLMRSDPDAAVRMLDDIGVLLRGALARASTQEVTLREELVTLRSFLEVEHARLGRRLDIRWDVEDGALEGCVPHMILQPLVENAVKHGLTPRASAGRIEVTARRGDRELELVVRDDGVGLGAAPQHAERPGHRGVGLSNTRARLSELYGPVAHLELSRGEAGGTVARVRIPWHLDTMHDIGHAGGGTGSAPARPVDQPGT